ncbi:outer membrane porin, OprD family [Pseudomonas sp. RW407]|uniref:OprD family porin n=1 Tax=Pseudomonas sp. RW407 TaxID=2202894 RepID=UPI000D6FEEE8|nr:OprD family porin [Pseudomonas sp. RW407]PWU28510.1 outer membrane porin, OprD family [Pseudomonas sp. RW407]
MNKNNKGTVFLLTTLAASGPALADGFLEDGKASLGLRNFYMNRDFRDGAGRSKGEEWAQGFLLDYRSGYTAGTLGVGVDVLGKLGVKLDSSPERSGTGLLPVQGDGRAADDYARLDPTAKLRLSRTELKLGALVPKLPTVQPNYGRLFPQVFQGGLLTSSEFDGLTLNLGRLDEVSQRNEAGTSDLALYNRNGRFAAAARADHFYLGGLDYRFTANWTGSYHYGQLEDVYDQHFLGLKGRTPIGADSLEADLRLAISRDAGAGRGGRIDNRAFNGLFTYRLHNGHAFGLGFQAMDGASAYPYLDGTDPYLIDFGQYGDFAEAGETSWQLRYDYDFAPLGLPGLSFMTRYFSGHGAEPTAGGGSREWERNSDIRYVLQGGPLKGLGLTWRNATYRSGFSRDVDENRVYLSYEVALF